MYTRTPVAAVTAGVLSFVYFNKRNDDDLGLKNNKQYFIFNASRDWKPMEMFLDVVVDMGVTRKSGNESCS